MVNSSRSISLIYYLPFYLHISTNIVLEINLPNHLSYTYINLSIPNPANELKLDLLDAILETALDEALEVARDVTLKNKTVVTTIVQGKEISN